MSPKLVEKEPHAKPTDPKRVVQWKRACARERLAELAARGAAAVDDSAVYVPPAFEPTAPRERTERQPHSRSSRGDDRFRRSSSLSPRAEARKKRQRRKEADDRWLARFFAKGEAAGHTREKMPPNIPRICYSLCRAIMDDPTGHACRVWIRRFASRQTGVALAMLRQAALGPLGGGVFERDWSDDAARRMLAIGLVQLQLAKARRGGGRRWGLCVRGVSIPALAGLLHAPGDRKRRPHRNTIGGAGRKPEAARQAAARARWGHAPAILTPHVRRSDLARLRDAGFLYAQQLPPDAATVEPWEVVEHVDPNTGRVLKHTINRYWLAGPGAQRSATTYPDFARLNHLGFEFGNEHPRTSRSQGPAPPPT
jgi:hypothetical protein